MAVKYPTPGVYINEINSFPNVVVPIETSVPVFIGYTEKASDQGRSILRKAVQINSLSEYNLLFGGGFNTEFDVSIAGENDNRAITISGISQRLQLTANSNFYLYNAVRLFYANGGGNCYIYSVGTYGDQPNGSAVDVNDFISTGNTLSPFDDLLQIAEPTLVVIPDAIVMGTACYEQVYTKALLHCRQTQSRFAILDLVQQDTAGQTDEVIAGFRAGIGSEALDYGAAYYPWLYTTLFSAEDISLNNFSQPEQLANLLPETAAKTILAQYQASAGDDEQTYHNALVAASPAYVQLVNAILPQMNLLPPSGAIAGVYTATDNQSGVWQSPANVALRMVQQPAFPVSDVEQGRMNMDPSGKSINAIRAFPDRGTLVWGGRTLDGNSLNWRYIATRRTLIMIEQSIKLALQAYIFQPNNAVTWASAQSMLLAFLTNLWQQGGLVGNTAASAFSVNVGLGATMTAQDILDGKMIIALQVAVLRPAEFIMLTLQQQMQQS